MKRSTSLQAIFLLAPILGLSLTTEAWAGPQVTDFSQDTCTGSNCGSLSITGTYDTDLQGNANPFTLQVFSQGDECVRLDVTSSFDLEAVLVGPDGTIWRDDDAGVDNNPLIAAITPVGVQGWYTLQISEFDGVGGVDNFTLNYGRYNKTNGNCANATAPTLVPAAEGG